MAPFLFAVFSNSAVDEKVLIKDEVYCCRKHTRPWMALFKRTGMS